MTTTWILVILGCAGMVVFGIWLPIRIARRTLPWPTTPLPPGVGAPIEPARHARVLSGWELAIALAISGGLFLVLLGPVWERHYDVDRAIGWSYLVIPPVVAALLLRRRAFGVARFALGTFAVAVAKFALTAGIIVLTWATVGPTIEPAAVPAWITFGSSPARTLVPAASTRDVAGTVVDAGDRPVHGATVWIAAGVEGFTLPTRADAVAIPAQGWSIAQAGQPLVSGWSDRELHTLSGADGHGKVVFNLAFPAGVEQARPVPDTPGRIRLGCAVHPGEDRGELLVLRHPFFTTTGSDGRFELLGVPEGTVRLAARSASGAEALLEVIGPGEVRLTLPEPQR